MKLEEIKPLYENLTDEDSVKKSAEKAVELFNKSMKSLFSGKDYQFNARLKKQIGVSLVVDFSESKYENDIIQNANQRVHLMMHMSDKSTIGYQIKPSYEFKELTLSRQLNNAGIKFRKIKGKTPEEAMKKVIAWFKKNKKGILESDKPNRDIITKKMFKSFAVPMADRKSKKVEVTISGGRQAEAVGVEHGDKIILQDLPDDKFFELAKVLFLI